MIALPDINVLLALAWSHHAHHEAAHRWFARDAASGWATCLLTQTGFLRLSLNRQIVGVSIDCQAAVHLLRGLVAHPHHQDTDIAPALTTTRFDELAPKILGYRQVSAATLLYMARLGELKLVTFDRPVAAVCPWPEHLELLTVKRHEFHGGKVCQTSMGTMKRCGFGCRTTASTMTHLEYHEPTRHLATSSAVQESDSYDQRQTSAG